MAFLSMIFTVGIAKGAAYASYNPRILLAGFTIQGRTSPVSAGSFLTAATYLCFGLFCFLPVILELTEQIHLKNSRKHAGADIGMTYRRIYEELEQEG